MGGKLLALTPGPSPVGKASTGEGSVYAGLIDLCCAADAIDKQIDALVYDMRSALRRSPVYQPLSNLADH